METKPALDASLVQGFVGNTHGDLHRVKALLAPEPALINACWDWGGDFETRLGATDRMGRRDIAEFLLENSARLDLFAAALRIPGPHGIPLIAHAQAGGEDAKEVLEFLENTASKID